MTVIKITPACSIKQAQGNCMREHVLKLCGTYETPGCSQENIMGLVQLEYIVILFLSAF